MKNSLHCSGPSKGTKNCVASMSKCIGLSNSAMHSARTRHFFGRSTTAGGYHRFASFGHI